jgi:oxalate decarboxylase/phosphoglucose isomerase-like protein (cupin superfamily)
MRGPGPGPPLHVHGFSDECIYVLDGQMEIQVGQKQMTTMAIRTPTGARAISLAAATSTVALDTSCSNPGFLLVCK